MHGFCLYFEWNFFFFRVKVWKLNGILVQVVIYGFKLHCMTTSQIIFCTFCGKVKGLRLTDTVHIRVCTGPGKSWNFIVSFSRTGKFWKKATGPGKFWKSVKPKKKLEMYDRQ